MKVVMRPFLPYPAVGFEQLLGAIDNDVDHLVQVGDAGILEYGVADDMSQNDTSGPARWTSGLPERVHGVVVTTSCFAEQEFYSAGTCRVPASATRTFAKGQFNAFCMRGVCHRAIKAVSQVVVYRAKAVSTVRTSLSHH